MLARLMTTRADVTRLTAASRRAVALALAELEMLFASLPVGSPELARDLLLEAYPALVAKHGQIAATAAGEWYEQTRAKQVVGSYAASLGSGPATDEVVGVARANAGGLWGENPRAVAAALVGPTQKFVAQWLRGTVAHNVTADPEKPRWARVPSGSKTCAFCMVMSSRGFVYSTPNAAKSFHAHCDCQIVPEWSKKGNPIKGYDPNSMLDLYNSAKAESSSGDIKDVLEVLRRRHPSKFTDGVPAK